ncbi:SDR family oxidoreductase [Desmospora profundinema]|uniref:NAD(P)-dependent dehydrogenase (Short-subunit alcohol dehydrogenase family) n=1 Tax=Desmospora profundinema TaxID=1571184 RepID=A0ABU1IP81_9BACL|nr:SDR family oxidoreductase [Desmospora profundinema]MDR6226203.1 NAD(P)-dependent dehydrogenase (short-subunit alcohol dehydrogenase family) [Desmospora profundinema]
MLVSSNNAISLGWIDVTPWQKRFVRQPETLSQEDHRQHPAGRVGRPEDIVRAVRFLASEEADLSFIWWWMAVCRSR